MNLNEYRDKVLGCWLGKCVIGTLGAPYEGIKQNLDIKFEPSMIAEMLPNDDLDLQVLWLDALERKGVNVTSDDLAEVFYEKNIKWPGEYAYFRKNYERGIRPPYSGIYENDFYRDGMGCPIRAEIWGMILPLNPLIAASLSEIDGTLDHFGTSVYLEKFWAYMVSEAFGESDISALIEHAKSVLPQDSTAFEMVSDVLKWCEEFSDEKKIRSYIIGKYGHCDCTNALQNIGFTLCCLLKGGGDIIKTGVMACDFGFDTDCTAGNSGALLGLILGAKKLKELYGIDDCRYKLTLKYERRSDLVSDLAYDTVKVGLHFLNNFAGAVKTVDGGKDEITLPPEPLVKIANYYDEPPYIASGEKITVRFEIENNSEKTIAGGLSVVGKENFECKLSAAKIAVEPESAAEFFVEIYCKRTDYLADKNIFAVKFKGESGLTAERKFGVIGKRRYLVYGPFWENNVELEIGGGVRGYGDLITGSSVDNRVDNLRFYQLNMKTTVGKEYLKVADLFNGFEDKSRYETTAKEAFVNGDKFDFSEISSFRGPATYYLKRTVRLDEDKRTCLFVGHTHPYELYIDGELLLSSSETANMTPENNHKYFYTLKAGEHTIIIVLRNTSSVGAFSLIINNDDELGQYPYPFFEDKTVR